MFWSNFIHENKNIVIHTSKQRIVDVLKSCNVEEALDTCQDGKFHIREIYNRLIIGNGETNVYLIPK
jgi:hypothetical protein